MLWAVWELLVNLAGLDWIAFSELVFPRAGHRSDPAGQIRTTRSAHCKI